mgnify:CR=1 FL=1
MHVCPMLCMYALCMDSCVCMPMYVCMVMYAWLCMHVYACVYMSVYGWMESCMYIVYVCTFASKLFHF